MHKHIPVLLDEVIEGLNLKKNYNIIDATLGGGGHAQEILKKTAPHGKLIGFDLDPQAIKLAQKNLQKYNLSTSLGVENRVIYIPSGYQTLKQKQNEQLSQISINGILLDLGLSLYQLQESDRGFSFLGKSSLDMRYDRNDQKINAEYIINNFKEEELADIFYRYGEERLSRQIASLIVKRRTQEKIDSPNKLVKIIELIYRSKFKSKSQKHPATKVFQALRIYCNEEFNNLNDFLPQAIDVLEPGGRFVVISYHSLEDKIVKEYFKKESRDCICPPELPECRCGHQAQIKSINRKVIVPAAEEIKNNPASRSAKLRIVEKI
jgi:16S rRNA (cytosine1402-N4)-methyltransferase